ncbi:MAG: hypothetical protein ABI222_10125 [Opitutaceae bacterium]
MKPKLIATTLVMALALSAPALNEAMAATLTDQAKESAADKKGA